MLYTIFLILIFVDLLLYRYVNLKKILIPLNFLFMWIFLGWARGAYDVEIGISRYIDVEHYTSFTEPLFTFLVSFGNKIGMSYRTFYVIIAFVELFLMYRFINRYSNSSIFVIALFMIFPMTYVFTLSRFFIAYCIVLGGAIYVLFEKKKHYEIKFIVLVLIACLIHYSAAFFFLYLIADKLRIKRLWLFTIIVSLALCSVTSLSWIINIFSEFINAEKISNILNNSVGHGILGRTVTSLIMFFSYFLSYHLCKNNVTDNSKWNLERNELVYKINIINLISIPLVIFYAIGFSRIFTISLILYYVSYSNMLIKNNIDNINKKRILSIIIIMFCMIFNIYMTYRGTTMQEESLKPMFEQNEFVSYFE